MISDEYVEEVREVVKNRGFMPSPALVRAVVEAHTERTVLPEVDASTLAALVTELHPRVVVRRANASGVERDHEFCTWCSVEWPCPTVSALQELVTGG